MPKNKSNLSIVIAILLTIGSGLSLFGQISSRSQVLIPVVSSPMKKVSLARR